jgi:hypothetical protein
MDINQKKELFSIAYVRAVASVVGCNVIKPEIDEDSIDLSLAMKMDSGRIRYSKLDMQLKCTSKSSIINSVIQYDLHEKNFDNLRNPDCLVPRVLIVTLVPDDPAEWVEQDQNRLLMKKCSYWFSLKSLPKPSPPPYRVHIPDTQIFNTQALLNMMQNISNGISL